MKVEKVVYEQLMGDGLLRYYGALELMSDESLIETRWLTFSLNSRGHKNFWATLDFAEKKYFTSLEEISGVLQKQRLIYVANLNADQVISEKRIVLQ